MPASLLSTLPETLAGQLSTARELVRERRDDGDEGWLATASPLDRVLGGGLHRGAMVELVGRRSSGRFSLVLATLAAATASGETAALVDLGDSLDPRTAEAAGVDLERLLWVRPRRVKEALASAEAILACGMPLVVVELGMPPLAGGRGAEGAWRRLARAARDQEAALLVASPYRASGTAAAAVLECRERRAHWQGLGRAPRLLRGLAPRLELLKSQYRRPGGKEAFGLRSGDAVLSARDETRPEPDRPGVAKGAHVLPFRRHPKKRPRR